MVDAESLVAGGEGQSCEFKESLSSGLQEDAIKALVAFANTTGGTVFFGVKDDRIVTGVNIGSGSIGALANRITQQTYPSLPATISTIDVNGKTVVRVDVARDVPPLIGAYLKSSERLDPDSPVQREDLACYRRVGSTNQQVNLMHVRPALPSDPDIVVRRGGGVTRGDVLPKEWSFEFSNAGPGWAYSVTFAAERPDCDLEAERGPHDLPPPSQEEQRYLQRRRKGAIRTIRVGPDASGPVLLNALCFDSRRQHWRFAVELEPRNGDYFLGYRSSTIDAFPPKRELAG